MQINGTACILNSRMSKAAARGAARTPAISPGLASGLRNGTPETRFKFRAGGKSKKAEIERVNPKE